MSIGAASSIVGLTDGEGGANTLDYSSFGFGGTWVNLGTGVATGTGGVQNFQSVIGSAGSDVIIGDGADNSLAGNGGNDLLAGGDGADTLSSGSGHDVVKGGDGDDILTGGSGLDLLLGGDGNDTYVLENGSDVVIDDGGAADLATSTISRSLLSLGLIGVEDLTLVGAAANGTGNHLANLITGNDAANTIDGWLGNDTLLGLAGNDVLIGGFGKDAMTGGLDDDTFRFTATAHSAVGAGADVITDFDDFGNDRIDLSALTGPALAYRHDLDFNGARQVRINDIAGDDVIVEVNLGGSLAADMQFGWPARISPRSRPTTSCCEAKRFRRRCLRSPHRSPAAWLAAAPASSRCRAGDPDDMPRAARDVGADLDLVHLEPRLSQAPGEMRVRPRRPDRQHAAIAECGARGGKAGHIVEPVILGAAQALRPVVDVEQDRVKAGHCLPYQQADIRLVNCHARIVEAAAMHFGHRAAGPGDHRRHQLRDGEARIIRQFGKRCAQRESHSQSADEDPRLKAPADFRAPEPGQCLLGPAEAAVHQLVRPEHDRKLGAALLQPKLAAAGYCR